MFKRLISEWKLSTFSTVDANGRSIDIQATFLTAPTKVNAAIKITLTLYTILSMFSTIFFNPLDHLKSFWMAKLTNWGQVISVIYLIVSVLGSTVFSSSSRSSTAKEGQQGGQQDEHWQDNDDRDRRVTPYLSFWNRLTWALFVMSFNLQVFVVILYWVLVYKPGVDIFYMTVFGHGIILVVVFIDGLVLNRTPVRFKQIGFAYILPMSFLIWSLIHAALGIGNPDQEDEDPETDDDSIYESLNWNERPGSSAILATILIFAGIPMLFLVVWCISNIFPHRYMEDHKARDDGEEFA